MGLLDQLLGDDGNNERSMTLKAKPMKDGKGKQENPYAPRPDAAAQGLRIPNEQYNVPPHSGTLPGFTELPVSRVRNQNAGQPLIQLPGPLNKIMDIVGMPFHGLVNYLDSSIGPWDPAPKPWSPGPSPGDTFRDRQRLNQIILEERFNSGIRD